MAFLLLTRGWDIVRAANRGDANSQELLGVLHFMSASRLDILQGAPADDDVVAARWTDALRYIEMAAEQGRTDAQKRCGFIYASGDRSVPQNWATAVKWWRKAAEAGEEGAQWFMGQCYYYGRGVEQDAAQARAWFRKAAAQGNPVAAHALQSHGYPGTSGFAAYDCSFYECCSTPPRHKVAHEFAMLVHEFYHMPDLQECNEELQEFGSAVPHQSPRDSVWVGFMMNTGLSDEEVELAKHIYAYSKRTCTFCGSNAVPLRKCSLCMELRYCIGTDCQHAHWNKTPAAESHKVLCPRIFVRGSKGRIRRVAALETSSSSS
jgi:TPR repeat protein